MEDVVRVLSTLALMGAVRGLAGRYWAAGGARIDADFAPTLGLLDRLRGGEAADVVILTRQALDDLATQGSVVSRQAALISRVPLSASRSRPAPPIPTSQPSPHCARRCSERVRSPIHASAPAASSSRS
ncbi:substrate-binding domain-containing protein [Bradyrhizobium sp.]|uniref:substrate-binding domain-containing protein n=1 Tax=Bradyrhizobium sp. TaxID=376 RepID=UPI003443D9A7